MLLFAVIGFALVAATQFGFIWLLGPIIDEAFTADNHKDYVWIPISIAILFVIRSFASFLGLYYIGSIGQKVVKSLRGEMHEKLLHLSSAQYDASTLGNILSKFTFDVERV